jgi:hypothetical protein
MPLLFAKVCTTSNKWNLIRKGRKASEYNLSPQAHTSSGNPADDYEVFDSNRRVVGALCFIRKQRKICRGFWTITAREIPPSVHNRGYSATREQAMADFKMRWARAADGATGH